MVRLVLFVKSSSILVMILLLCFTTSKGYREISSKVKMKQHMKSAIIIGGKVIMPSKTTNHGGMLVGESNRLSPGGPDPQHHSISP